MTEKMIQVPESLLDDIRDYLEEITSYVFTPNQLGEEALRLLRRAVENTTEAAHPLPDHDVDASLLLNEDSLTDREQALIELGFGISRAQQATGDPYPDGETVAERALDPEDWETARSAVPVATGDTEFAAEMTGEQACVWYTRACDDQRF
jgi:hypothetical protein